MKMVSYSTMYPYYEMLGITFQETITNLATSALAVIIVLFVLLPLGPSLLAVICVLLADVCILAWIPLTGLNLNAITSICMVMSVGIAVDFSSHVTHAFVETKSEGRSGGERAASAVTRMGRSLTTSGLTTFLSVFMLCTVKVPSNRAFFTMMSGVVLYGVLFGLVLLPTLLSIFNPSYKAPHVLESPMTPLAPGEEALALEKSRSKGVHRHHRKRVEEREKEAESEEEEEAKELKSPKSPGHAKPISESEEEEMTFVSEEKTHRHSKSPSVKTPIPGAIPQSPPFGPVNHPEAISDSDSVSVGGNSMNNPDGDDGDGSDDSDDGTFMDAKSYDSESTMRAREIELAPLPPLPLPPSSPSSNSSSPSPTHSKKGNASRNDLTITVPRTSTTQTQSVAIKKANPIPPPSTAAATAATTLPSPTGRHFVRPRDLARQEEEEEERKRVEAQQQQHEAISDSNSEDEGEKEEGKKNPTPVEQSQSATSSSGIWSYLPRLW